MQEGVYAVKMNSDGTAVVEPGQVEYQDGSKYNGGLIRGLRDGFGTLTWSTGEVYEGEWKLNERYGKGRLTTPNGGVYEGEWKADKPHGRGSEVFPGGSKYEGTYMEGKIHGRGVLTYPSGNVYEGLFKDDLKHGRGQVRGVVFMLDGQVLFVSIEEEVFRVLGGFSAVVCPRLSTARTFDGISLQVTYANGDVCVATWEAGKRTGVGTLQYAVGRRYGVEFHDDHVVRMRGM